MGRRTKQTVKKRGRAHRVMALKLRARKNRIKNERHRHRNRQAGRRGKK
jgi:hypothetical protein